MRHLALSLRDRPLFADWKVALSAIGIFWAAYLLTLVARSLLIGEFATLFASRLPTILFGMLLTLGIYAVLQLVAAHARMRSRAIVAMIASLVAALVQAAFIVSSAPSRESSSQEYRMEAREGAIIIQKGNEIRIQRQSDEAPMVFTLPGVEEMAGRQRLRIAADAAVAWFFFFASFSGVYLALYSAARADSAQRRLAEAEAAAHAAQVRALRYQVNPHFLFNTLNSLSSLVMTERTEQAEEMLIALSEFFRTSLSLDASAGITLEREIQLQQLYLEIEQQRFPDRLDVDRSNTLRRLAV